MRNPTTFSLAYDFLSNSIDFVVGKKVVHTEILTDIGQIVL